jgi:hypothetical protein
MQLLQHAAIVYFRHAKVQHDSVNTLPVTRHQPCSTILRHNDFIPSFLQDSTYQATVLGIVIYDENLGHMRLSYPRVSYHSSLDRIAAFECFI